MAFLIRPTFGPFKPAQNGPNHPALTFSQITGCVHAIYKYAMTFEHLPIIDLPKSIDCSMLSFRQAGQTNDDIIAEALTKSQLGRAFVWCSEHCDDIVVLALWLNFYLGLRFAELYALRWCDVHLQFKKIHICGQMDKKGHVRLDYTKHHVPQGNRDVPMTNKAISVFQQILAQKPENAKDEDLILPVGGYYTYRRRCRDCFSYALQTDDLPDHYVTHTIRTTAASIWYASGLSPKKIKKLLGHTTINMTLRYCKDPDEDEKTREMMNKAM